MISMNWHLVMLSYQHNRLLIIISSCLHASAFTMDYIYIAHHELNTNIIAAKTIIEMQYNLCYQGLKDS